MAFIYREKTVFCAMRKKDPQKTAAIFKALLLVLQEEGSMGLQMSKIAQKAGLATGTLYLYFKSKEQLLKAALPYFGSMIYEDWQPKINEELLYEAQIRGLWLHYLQFLEQNPSYFLLAELQSPAERQELEGAFIQPLQELINIGIIRHQLKDVPLYTLTTTVYGILLGFFRLQTDDHNSRPTFQAHHLWSITWDAIRK